MILVALRVDCRGDKVLDALRVDCCGNVSLTWLDALRVDCYGNVSLTWTVMVLALHVDCRGDMITGAHGCGFLRGYSLMMVLQRCGNCISYITCSDLHLFGLH